MGEIKAFVGHSFNPQDEAVVRAFTKYFDQVHLTVPEFSWEHAEPAEAEQVPTKVLRYFEGKNAFLAICTRAEWVIAEAGLKSIPIFKGSRLVNVAAVQWKTSDWIIQEIGFAVARGLKIIIFLEGGVRPPGALQGNIEYIPFNRDRPEQAFGRFLEMVSKLSPGAPTTAATAGSDDSASSDEAKAKEEAEADPAWFEPQTEWTQKDYERALMRADIFKDEGAAKRIHEAFAATKHARAEGVLSEWDAFSDSLKVIHGEEGAFERLQTLAADNPQNPRVLASLGHAYSHYGNHECAAVQFNAAAELALSREDKIRWRGNQVHHLVAGGRSDEARKVLASLRELAQADVEAEKAYLRVARDYAKQIKDEELEVAVLERAVELSPDDADLRFSLAYKHSESDRNDLSLAHYLNIDVDRRSAITWNNLGAAYELLAMPAKSIAAYKRAKAEGETLAMSNLANRLMHTGFLDEAQAELDEAVKSPEYSNNVNHSLARFRDIPGDEDKKLSDVSEESRSKTEFYRAVGRAVSKPGFGRPDFAKWEGPDCALTIEFDGDLLLAKGSYARKANALGLFGGLGVQDEKMTIAYSGRTFGRAAFGEVKRSSEKDQPSYLGSNQDPLDFQLVLSDDGLTAEVVENPGSRYPRFYTLKRIAGETLDHEEQALLPAS